MTDELTTEAAKILDGAETAVGDLLTSLRLPADNNTVVAVLDWLDKHGVLDAVDDAAHKIAAEAEAAAAEPAPLDGVTDAPVAAVPAATVPAAAGEGSSLASGAAPPAAAPLDPTPASLAVPDGGGHATVTTPPVETTASGAQALLDQAEAKVEAAGEAEVSKVESAGEKEAAKVAPEVKAGLTDALHNVLSWVEKL